MKILKLSAVIFFFVILSGLTNQIQAQPEFATVRLVSTKYQAHLLISKGSSEMKTIELASRLHVNYTKQLSLISSDNQLFNSAFQELYVQGYKLISTTSTSHASQGATIYTEVIFMLVKE